MQKDWDADAETFIAEEKVEFKVGKSYFTGFIKTHDYIDCIIEALQNDFDARSSETLFNFGEDFFTIQGNGEPVDDNGWNRLSYSLGYNSASERKIGSIGNKNQGVRSYLIFGDNIIFRSAGKRVRISLDGSSPKPKDDELTKSSRGVNIRVSFRITDNPEEGLRAFTIEQEEKLIDAIWNRLPGYCPVFK
jgi:hypothetical protein